MGILHQATATLLISFNQLSRAARAGGTVLICRDSSRRVVR